MTQILLIYNFDSQNTKQCLQLRLKPKLITIDFIRISRTALTQFKRGHVYALM